MPVAVWAMASLADTPRVDSFPICCQLRGLRGSDVPAAASNLFPTELRSAIMCRNIKTLANFEPPATDDEIRASALQFVRKLSGATRPSRANEPAFNQAVDDVAAAARRLVNSLRTTGAPRNRDEETRKARERSRKRFARDETPGARAPIDT